MKNKSVIAIAAAFAGIAALPTMAQANEKVDFASQIYPIFEAKCIKCHTTEHVDPKTNRTKKPKGGYTMDTKEGLLKGGKEGGDKTLIPGKSAESDIVKLVSLPPSDELAMPPEGKADPLTDAEKELLKKWIDAGADFGTWTKAEKK